MAVMAIGIFKLFLLEFILWSVSEAYPFSEVDNSVNSVESDIEQKDIIDLSHLGSSIFGEPDEAVGKIVKTNLLGLIKIFYTFWL